MQLPKVFLKVLFEGDGAKISIALTYYQMVYKRIIS